MTKDGTSYIAAACRSPIVLLLHVGRQLMDLLLHVGRQFPDKAIDLIDEACATTRMQIAAKQKKLNSSRQALGNKAKVVVCPEHVAQVSSHHTYAIPSLLYTYICSCNKYIIGCYIFFPPSVMYIPILVS